MKFLYVWSILGLFMLLLSFPLHALAQATSEHFPLVDGSRQAVVVGDYKITACPENGYYTLHPDALVYYIQQSTGQLLKTVSEKEYSAAQMPLAIFVGDTAKSRELFGERLKTLDADGYIVHVTPTLVVLTANSKQGLAWAVFDFLRETMGIDCYIPHPLFTVVPKHERVLVPVQSRVEVPAFASRDFSGINSSRGLRGQAEIPYRYYRRFNHGHALSTFITPAEFGQAHPEYFAMRNGRRIIASSTAGASPCISNPEVQQIILRKVREQFDKQPQLQAISLSMDDGGYCECDTCNASDEPSIKINDQTTSMSGRYYRFVNVIAAAVRQSHPGKFITVLGYAGADYPPAFPVERNIMPYLCYNRANWANPTEKARDLAIIDAWTERVDRIGIYEYLYGMGYSVPRLYNRSLAELLKHVAEKCPGSGFYAEIYSNHGLDGPKLWIAEKLIWNPHQNPDVLLERWCNALFGKSSGLMRQYFDELEQTWIRNSPRVGNKQTGKFFGYTRDEQFELFLPQDLTKLWAILDQAKAQADSDVVRERIEYFASTLKITDATVREYHTYSVPTELASAHATPQQVLASLLEADSRNVQGIDVPRYTAELIANDPTRFLQGVMVSRSAQVMQDIFNDHVWKTVYESLRSGERDITKLRSISETALRSITNAKDTQDPRASERIKLMLALTQRLCGANRITKPPVIDGVLDDACWQWVNQAPWVAGVSGKPREIQTQFAFAYDQQNLYVALRCPQTDLPATSPKGMDTYGVPAWKEASVELFINPDARDASPEQIPYYQIIASAYGGVWESSQRALGPYKITRDAQGWVAEFVLDWKKMGLDPDKIQFMRMNLVRNLHNQNTRNSACWYTASYANKNADARGWLILQ